jgi:hypothetical protein
LKDKLLPIQVSLAMVTLLPRLHQSKISKILVTLLTQSSLEKMEQWNYRPHQSIKLVLTSSKKMDIIHRKMLFMHNNTTIPLQEKQQNHL